MAVDDLWHLSRPKDGDKPCGEHGKLVASDRHGRGKRWRVRYIDPDGKPKTEAFEKQADATAFDLSVRSSVNRGDYVDPDAGTVTLRAYAERWLTGRAVAPSTREGMKIRFRNHIYPTLGDKKLREIATEPTAIREWHKKLIAKGLSRGYVETIYKNLSSVLTAALEDKRIVSNPCRLKSVKPPRPEKRKVIPWEQSRVLAVRDGLPPRYQATLDSGAGAGMRQGEVLGLAVDDVDWLRFNIHVCRQVAQVHGRLVFAPPKFGKERDVPLSDDLAQSWAAHLQQWPARAITLPWIEPDGKPVTARLIFTSREGKAVNRNYFNAHLWKPALAAAGVIPEPEPGERYDPSRDQGFHQLRHYWASVLLAEGVDIRTLAEYLGHDDPGFTLRTYTHLMQSSADKARRAAGTALRRSIVDAPGLAAAPTVPSLYRAAR